MNSIETESTVSVNQSQNNSKPGLSIKKKHTVVAYSGDNTTVYSGKVSALKPTFGFIIFSFNASETSVYFQLSAYQDTIPIQKGSNVQFTLASDSSERSRAVNIHIVNSTTQITTTNVSRDTSIKPLIQSDNQTKAEISIESSTLKLQPKVSPPLFDGPSSGFKANVAWRAVEMNDLRLHPLFKELEVTENIQVQSAQDFSRFRQDSWQWDALHQGRLTTSRAAACLGFYEVKAGQAMTIPSSLLGHERTLGSWQVLMETAPQDWSYLNENKNNVDSESMSKGQKGSSGTSSASSSSATAVSSRSIWKPSVNGGSKRFPFAYTPMKGSDRAHIPLLYPNPRSARLAWGSTQEATGILVLVNYLHSLGRGSTVSESGLLPSEVLDPSFEPLLKEWVSGSIDESTGFAFLNRSCPLLGASPDALIHHADGTMEVAEVKCSSPFIQPASSSAQGKNSQSGQPRRMVITQHSRPYESVGAWHIPQLQLEILCAGPQCTGAVLVALSALDGASLFRIPRDNTYIAHMLKLLKFFYETYCITGKEPPENFFSLHHDQHYATFFESTLRIARSAERIAKVPQENVQRSPLNNMFFVN